MLGFIEIFDTQFLRLVWALFVDYLISSGYLLPQQRQLWVDGYVNIVGAIGAIIFLGIWLHHANKKDYQKQLTGDVANNTTAFNNLLNGIKNYVFVKKTDTPPAPEQSQ